MSVFSYVRGKVMTLRDRGLYAFFGMETITGKPVTVDSALNLSTAWACIRLLSETVGTLPLGVFEELANEDKGLAKDYFLYPLLHDQPNADRSACEYWEGVTVDLCTWGNHFAEREVQAKKTRALTMLEPELTRMERRADGTPFFVYTDRGKRVELPEDKVFHVRGFGAGRDMGFSPIGYARNSLALATAVEETSGAMHAGGIRPSGFLTVDKVLKAEQREQVRKNLLEPYVGSNRAGGVMLLEAGMEFKPVTMNPIDAQMLETRSFNVEDICRWFRVPPFMIGHTEKSTSWGTGLEQQNIGFLTYALRPYLVRIEQAIRRQLIPVEDRRRYTPEWNLEGLLRADSAARAAYYSTMTQNGIMKRSEARRKENLPFVAGSDVLTVQSALVLLDQLGQASAQETEAAKNAFRKFLGIVDNRDESRRAA